MWWLQHRSYHFLPITPLHLKSWETFDCRLDAFYWDEELLDADMDNMNRSVGKVRGFDNTHMWYLQNVFLFVVCPSGLFRKSCWHPLVGSPSAGFSFATGKEKKIQLLWSFLFARVHKAVESFQEALFIYVHSGNSDSHFRITRGTWSLCKYREIALLWILWHFCISEVAQLLCLHSATDKGFEIVMRTTQHSFGCVINSAAFQAFTH